VSLGGIVSPACIRAADVGHPDLSGPSDSRPSQRSDRIAVHGGVGFGYVAVPVRGPSKWSRLLCILTRGLRVDGGIDLKAVGYDQSMEEAAS